MLCAMLDQYSPMRPLTSITSPVRKDDASEFRNSAAFDVSSGWQLPVALRDRSMINRHDSDAVTYVH